MAVYVDNAFIPAQLTGRPALWSHLTADTATELHQMAQDLGLKRSWFQDKRTPHYDVTKTVRAKAIKLGAIPIHWKTKQPLEVA